MNLFYCKKCLKVFYIERPLSHPWCPNCYEWRDHHKEGDFHVDDIELVKVPA